MRYNRFFSSVILIVVAVLYFPSPSFSAENDEGYFLSFRQKGQLICYGDIYDSDNFCYDIRIVPGYVPPTRIARRSWSNAGDEMGEYFHAGKYRHAKRNFIDSAEWTYQDWLWERTVKGVPKAWRRYFGKAHTFAEKRVFGWWMAYPWAFFQSTVDNVFRVPFGLSCATGGTLVCFIGVPARHTLNSISKATLIATFGGLALPAVGYSWNTVISPPLALFGQKPAASRVDGFWVRRTTKEQRKAEQATKARITDDELELIHLWGQLLMDEIHPFSAKWDEVGKKRDEAVKRAQKAAEKERLLLKEQENEVYERLKLSSDIYTSFIGMNGNFNRHSINANQSQLKRYLNDKGIKDEQCDTVVRLLKAYPPVTTEKTPAREKTDPVKETVKVIGDVD